MTKENDLWKNVFGRAAFTVQMIPSKEKDEDAALATKREYYVQMVQDAGAVQLSMGSANINGLVQFNKKYTLRRENADGTPAPTIRKSVQAVMRYQTLDEDNIWLAAIPRSGGGVTGYFSCVLPEIKSYIEQWTQCPTAQLYWFLLRKGCNFEDVRDMIRGCFSIEEVAKVSRSRWSKTRQFVVMDTGAGMDISTVANNNRAYDTNLDLSDKERRAKVAKSNGA